MMTMATTTTTTTTKMIRSTTVSIEQSQPTTSFISERIHHQKQTDAMQNATTNPTNDDERSGYMTNAPPFTEFLVPSGQTPTIPSPPGRASISKVQLLNPGPSPHAEDAQSSHLRLAKSSLHSSTSTQIPVVSPQNESNDSKNWYFVNYNRSNIEPFVGRLPIKVSRSEQRHPWLPLILFGLSLIFVS